MPATALALVLAAALLHALWNVVAKKAGGDDRFALVAALLVVGLWAPVGVWAGWGVLPQWRAREWAVVLASAVVHLVYFRTLLRGYRLSDLTVVYPVARGTGPLLSSLGAVVLLGEALSGIGVFGVTAVSVGIFFIAGGPALWAKAHDPAQRERVRAGLMYGSATGALIAGYTLIDGYAVKVIWSAMTADEKQVKLQRHRLRMTLLSALNTLGQSAVIALYAWAGEVAWSVALLFLVVETGSVAVFALIIWRGWNLRLKDPGLLLAQIAASVIIQLVFLVIAPQLWVLFIIAVLVTYNFAMISFSSRQFTLAWLLIGGAVGLALYVVRERFAHIGTSDVSIIILWLFLFFCIRQLTAIGTQFSSLRTKLSANNTQLAESLERIQLLASHDDLTGVLTRRSFMQLLAHERARGKRATQPFCVALFDIDHFKLVNDRYGHLMGDTVLKEFCVAASGAIRETDRFARYGGEEFILLLTPSTTPDLARIATERVRHAVEAHDWERLAPGLGVTISCGVTAYVADESIEQLVGRADRALYSAKDAGRNCTVLA